MNWFFNGQIIPQTEARLPVSDRGFLYGDGVFESLRTYQRIPFLLAEHLHRLFFDAKAIKLTPPFTKKQVASAVEKVIERNKGGELYLKIIMTRGSTQKHGLAFANLAGKPNFIIMAEPLPATGEKLWRTAIPGLIKAASPTSRLKSLCYLDNILALNEARLSGADEALLLNKNGLIIEGCVSNFFIVKNDLLMTPPLSEPILPGITRALVLKLAKRARLAVTEKAPTIREALNCDESFATLSGSGLIPIVKINNKVINESQTGEITGLLLKLYAQEIERYIKKNK